MVDDQMEDEQHRKQPKRKTIKMEDDKNGMRQKSGAEYTKPNLL